MFSEKEKTDIKMAIVCLKKNPMSEQFIEIDESRLDALKDLVEILSLKTKTLCREKNTVSFLLKNKDQWDPVD